MYQKCRLVHADLSEYNLLFHEGHIWIIDVSQSVDQDHPRCLEFLREDLLHVIQFFAKRDVAVPTVRELFDFVTDPAINDENMEAVLEALSESAEAQAVELKRVNAQLNALNSADPDAARRRYFRRIRAGDGVEKGSNCRRRRERHRSHGASRGTGDSGQRVPPGVHPSRATTRWTCSSATRDD